MSLFGKHSGNYWGVSPKGKGKRMETVVPVNPQESPYPLDTKLDQGRRGWLERLLRGGKRAGGVDPDQV